MASNTQISFSAVSLEVATRAIGAGRAKAAEIGVPSSLAVLDAGAHLVASARMDGATLVSIETSQTKARTAVLFGQPTKDLAAKVQPGAPLFTIEVATRDPLTFVPGGIPMRNAEGRVIGAIGVGGGTPDQDHEVAQAAVMAL